MYDGRVSPLWLKNAVSKNPVTGCQVWAVLFMVIVFFGIRRMIRLIHWTFTAFFVAEVLTLPVVKVTQE